jgi:Tol biopolymer transport system component
MTNRSRAIRKLPTLLVVVLAIAVTATGCTPARAPIATERPSAHQIAFGRFDNDDHTVGEVIITDSDGHGTRTLTAPPPGSVDETPDWAPDGGRLVFVRWTSQSEQIFSAAADGASVRALTASAPGTGGVGEPIPTLDEHPVYSPDGSKIAFIRFSGDERENVRQHSDVWVMDSDGSAQTNVTRLPDYTGELDGVEWSPDGQQLAYSVFNDTPGAAVSGGALFLTGEDGTNSRRLTAWKLNAGGVPDWSPATNVIAFRAVNDIEPGFGNIYTIRPDGTGLRQITHFRQTALSSKVSISADGEWVLFAKGDRKAIFVERVDGSSLRSIGTSKFYDSAPDWGPAS